MLLLKTVFRILVKKKSHVGEVPFSQVIVAVQPEEEFDNTDEDRNIQKNPSDLTRSRAQTWAPQRTSSDSVETSGVSVEDDDENEEHYIR